MHGPTLDEFSVPLSPRNDASTQVVELGIILANEYFITVRAYSFGTERVVEGMESEVVTLSVETGT